MKNCYNYEIEKDTAGQPIMGRRCNCGTTGCKNWGSQIISRNMPIGTYPFNKIVMKEEEEEKITPEEKRKFYEKVFGKGIL